MPRQQGIDLSNPGGFYETPPGLGVLASKRKSSGVEEEITLSLVWIVWSAGLFCNGMISLGPLTPTRDHARLNQVPLDHSLPVTATKMLSGEGSQPSGLVVHIYYPCYGAWTHRWSG